MTSRFLIYILCKVFHRSVFFSSERLTGFGIIDFLIRTVSEDQTLGGKRKNDGPTSVRKHVLANYILVHTCTILYSGLAEHTCQHPGVFRQGFHFFQCIVVVCQLITGLNDTLNTRLNKTLEILLPTESIARQYQESQTM